MSKKSTPTENTYITEEEAHKLAKASLALVDRSCVILDGSCECPRSEGENFPDCKYLKNKV